MQAKEVLLTEYLYRRSYSRPPLKFLNPDGSATSRVFKLREKDENKLSVDVKSMTTFEKSIKDQTQFVLFEIYNSHVYEIGLKTFHDPSPNGFNDAHAIIVGMKIEDDDILPGLLARKSKRVSFIPL